MSDLEQPEKKAISRRTVTKAMAWSVPAIAIAAPVPAMAASGGPPTIQVGNTYKWPGASCNNFLPDGTAFANPNKGYVMVIRVNNFSGKTIYLYDAEVTVSPGGPMFDVFAANPTFGTPIPTGGSVDVLLFANGANSANLNFSGTLCVAWGHNYPPPDPDNHPPVCVNFSVPCTPTPTSAGLQQCQFAFSGGANCQNASPFTGVVAGQPGYFEPIGVTPPFDLAALSTDPVIGNTGWAGNPAWTSGQWIALGDGSTAHWSGSAWVGAIAP